MGGAGPFEVRDAGGYGRDAAGLGEGANAGGGGLRRGRCTLRVN